MTAKDEMGKRYGRLTVMGRAEGIPYKNYRKARWKCKCDCGEETVAIGSDLREGHKASCGCLRHLPSVNRLPDEERLRRETHPRACSLCGQTRTPDQFRTARGYKLTMCKGCEKAKYKYGVDIGVLDTLSGSQNGACAICEGKTSDLVVDHCHSSGKIRGLLCRECNSMLGMSKDSQTTLGRAIQYLKQSAQSNPV